MVSGNGRPTSSSWSLGTIVNSIEYERDSLDMLIKSFWEVENNLNEPPPATFVDIIFEQHFQQTTIRVDSGA